MVLVYMWVCFICVYCMDPESLSVPILGLEIRLYSCMCFAIWDARTGILETEEDPQPCLLGVCYFASLVLFANWVTSVGVD